MRPDLPPVEFHLEKGRTIQGRVVDAKGEPLAGATVAVDGWRGHRTLDWRMTTDDEGEFRWTDAPPDAFWIGVSREGYLGINRREVPPAGGELTIAMVRQLKVRGTVVDAETPPCGQVVHPGAGDGARRKLLALLGSQPGAAGAGEAGTRSSSTT